MRAVIATGLVVEIVLAISWLAGLLPMLPAYGWMTLAMIGLRVGATALQMAAVSSLTQHTTAAPRLAAAAFLVSALLLTLELGARLTPTNVFPSHRWPIVSAYWVYASLGTLGARTLRR